MPFIQRSPRRHGRPIRRFVACIGGHPWALAPDTGKGQEQPGARGAADALSWSCGLRPPILANFPARFPDVAAGSVRCRIFAVFE